MLYIEIKTIKNNSTEKQIQDKLQESRTLHDKGHESHVKSRSRKMSLEMGFKGFKGQFEGRTCVFNFDPLY